MTRATNTPVASQILFLSVIFMTVKCMLSYF
jgi:hypothetical protein